MRLSVVAICACLSSVLAAQRPVAPRGPRTHAPEPTTADITVRDVTTRMYIIAADSMEGRDTGKRGGLRSATYIAGELKRLGLEPAGDGGSYLQRIPWVRRAPDTTGTISAGTNVFRWGADYILVPKIGFALALGGQPFGGSFQATDVPTVFGGRIGDSTISPNDVRDRVVVFTARRSRSGSATICGAIQPRKRSSSQQSTPVCPRR